jgi:type III restriction enzyme
MIYAFLQAGFAERMQKERARTAMKLKFKTQAFQTVAVQAVVECFKEQVPHQGGIRYRPDLGSQEAEPASPQGALTLEATPALLRRLKEAGILKELQARSGSRAATLCFTGLINLAEGRQVL